MDSILWDREAVSQLVKDWGVGVLSGDADVDVGGCQRRQSPTICGRHLQYVNPLLQRQGGDQINTTWKGQLTTHD